MMGEDNKMVDGITPAETSVIRNQQGKLGFAVLAVVLLALGFGVYSNFMIQAGVEREASKLANAAGKTDLPESLQSLAKQNVLTVDSSGQLLVNGQLRLNDSAVLDPANEPSSPAPGQLYLSRKDNLIYYYDGTKFVSLATNQQVSNPQTSDSTASVVNAGVLSLQGQSGSLNLSAGGGITINGLKISNAGVTSLSVGNGLQISGLRGDVMISLPQNISTSATPTFQGLVLVSQLGVGYGGTGSTSAAGARANLGAAGSGANSDITSISGLTTALSVEQGGTGATQFPSGAVLIGNNAGAVSFVSSAGPNKCLLSTNAAPIFTDCPGTVGGSVTAGTQSGGRLVKWGSLNQVTDSLLGDDGTQVVAYGDLISSTVTTSQTAFVVQDSDANKLLVADTENWKVTVTNLVVTGTLTVNGHIVTTGSTPVATEGVGIGNGTCSVTGNDTAGTVTISPTSGRAAGEQCIITFSSPFGSPPKSIIAPTSSNNYSDAGAYVTSTSTTMTINFSLTPSIDTFTYNYFNSQ